MRPVGPRDAVITGTGIVSPLGFGTERVFRALAAGNGAVREMGDAESGSARSQGAPVEPPYLRASVPRAMEPQIKFLNDSGEMAVEATIEAMAGSGVLDGDTAPPMRGLYLSQMDSNDWSCRDFRPAVVEATDSFANALEDEAMNRATARYVKPHFMLESLKNNAFSFLSTMFELHGANTSVAGFSGPTEQALSMGVRSLVRGTTNVSVVVGAAQIASATARLEMEDVGFSEDHVPGDGAGALVLERAQDAAARGVPALAAVLGQGFATHRPDGPMWVPDAEALNAAVTQALAEASCTLDDLLGVVLPGVGECAPTVGDLPCVTWKTHTGHLSLASAAVEMALGAKAVAAGALPGAASSGPGPGVLVLGAGMFGQVGAFVLAPT